MSGKMKVDAIEAIAVFTQGLTYQGKPIVIKEIETKDGEKIKVLCVKEGK